MAVGPQYQDPPVAVVIKPHWCIGYTSPWNVSGLVDPEGEALPLQKKLQKRHRARQGRNGQLLGAKKPWARKSPIKAPRCLEPNCLNKRVLGWRAGGGTREMAYLMQRSGTAWPLQNSWLRLLQLCKFVEINTVILLSCQKKKTKCLLNLQIGPAISQNQYEAQKHNVSLIFSSSKGIYLSACSQIHFLLSLQVIIICVLYSFIFLSLTFHIRK